MFKKLAKKITDKSMLMVLAGAVAIAALYYYSQGFSKSLVGMSNSNKAAEAVDNSPSSCAAGGNNFVPASAMGQNEGHAGANGAVTDTYGLPPSCAKQQVVDPSDLLPKGGNNEFSKLNPMGAGDLKNVSLLKAGHHIGINTVGQSLRNANQQIRSDPPVPQVNVGPWHNTTIEPDTMRVPLELGSAPALQ